MASIRTRGNSHTVIYYQNGKQRWETFDSEEKALARKKELEGNAPPKEAFPTVNKAKISAEEQPLTIQAYMEEFIEKYGSKKWGTSYYEANLSLLKNYVYPYWEGTLISEFTPKNIDDYFDHLTKNCYMKLGNKQTGQKRKVSPKIANDILKLMRCAFNRAKKWQLIPSNPFADAMKSECKERQRPALTPSQLEAVLEYTDAPEVYDLYVMHVAINLAFAGSMRGGEIGGLQWSDITNHKKRVLHIHKTIDRVSKSALEKVTRTEVFFTFPNLYPQCKSAIILKNTKEDGGSDRNCYLPEAVYEKLMTLQKLQKEIRDEYGYEGFVDFDLIISQINGRPIMTEHLNKRFQAILKELGIHPTGAKNGEQFVFHSLRATATTYKLRLSNGDIKAVQGENGQKDPTMVTKQYSRILDEDRIELSERMNQEFYGKKQSTELADRDALLQKLASTPGVLEELLGLLLAHKAC